MEELATAMMVVVFAAVLLVSGQLFTGHQSSKSFETSAAAPVTLRGGKTRSVRNWSAFTLPP